MKSVFYRYLWFFDTLWRNKRITRAEVNRLWMQSDWSNGEPMSRRTFINYRDAVEALFDVNIAYNSATYEYYIEPAGVNKDFKRGLYDMLSVNRLLRDDNPVASRIFPEEIPSGSDYFEQLVTAMERRQVVAMEYRPFWKIESKQVAIEPYFLKAFRKRWYVIGLVRGEQQIKTYALDRICDLSLTAASYDYPESFDAERYFDNCFGVMRTGEPVEEICLRTTMRQAQYFRALPLHNSQREIETGDGYVLFGYRLRVTYDLVQELLSLGREVEVLSPGHLRDTMLAHLQAALAVYGG